jgi:hypothetical protein
VAKRTEQRRQRKLIERQSRLDSQIIANAPVPAQQANYRRATELDIGKCTECRFNPKNDFCDLFDFDFVIGFTCDRFEPREEIILAEVGSRDLSQKNLLALSQEKKLSIYSYFNKSLTSYRRSIRLAVRGLRSENLDVFDFLSAMNSAIDRGYEQAWREGARTCGIQPNERTQEETSKLNTLISVAKASVFDFGEFIEARQDEPFSSVASRIDVWVNRYNEVKSTGSMMACANQKEIWELGEADHCSTCKKLDGRVMRNSRWAELDVVTQDTRPGKLECKGFGCKCTRTPTTKNATPGPLPSLP